MEINGVFYEKKQQNMLEYQEKAVPLQMKCLFSYMKTGIFAKHLMNRYLIDYFFVSLVYH